MVATAIPLGGTVFGRPRMEVKRCYLASAFPVTNRGALLPTAARCRLRAPFRFRLYGTCENNNDPWFCRRMYRASHTL
jgi:hypothetical protein